MTFAQKITAMADVADFESLKAAKTQQIADAEDLVETKSGDLATSDEKKASSKVKNRGDADLAGCGQEQRLHAPAVPGRQLLEHEDRCHAPSQHCCGGA